MNRRQRHKRDNRRSAHAAQTGRPRNVLSLDAYPAVNKAHIVPAVYQRGFAIDDRVAVHIDGASECVTMRVGDAGTRRRFYRRNRPDGSSIDDIEASLAVLEDKVQPALGALQSGGPLDNERKVALVQFVAMQMLRGPGFFAHRSGLATEIVDNLEPKDLRPGALARAGGDIDAIKGEVKDAYLQSTARLVSMVSLGPKVASILGWMRCQVIHFDAPTLVYSDHPVVVWPANRVPSLPFTEPHYGPLTAVEVTMPLSPHVAVVMTWQDAMSLAQPRQVPPVLAAQLNAFAIAQADRQWMHQPGPEPEANQGLAVPISTQLDPVYAPGPAMASKRRTQAEQAMKRWQSKQFLDDIDVAFDVV